MKQKKQKKKGAHVCARCKTKVINQSIHISLCFSKVVWSQPVCACVCSMHIYSCATLCWGRRTRNKIKGSDTITLQQCNGLCWLAVHIPPTPVFPSADKLWCYRETGYTWVHLTPYSHCKEGFLCFYLLSLFLESHPKHPGACVYHTSCVTITLTIL